jgi:hypothetical protein
LGGTTLTNNEIKFGKRQINLKVFPIRPAWMIDFKCVKLSFDKPCF